MLLKSERLRLNFNSQIFGHGGIGNQPLVFIFVKDTVPFISDTNTQFDYYNSVMNWSPHDGGSTSNRANMLGFCNTDATAPVGAFVPSADGLFVNWCAPITVVSSGTIGSVIVMHKGNYLTPTTYTMSSVPSVPASTATSLLANNIGIPEAVTAANYNTLGGGTVSGYDGSSYIYNSATTNTQYSAASMFYQNVIFSTDSVGIGMNSVIKVSSLEINSANPSFMIGMRLLISEGV